MTAYSILTDGGCSNFNTTYRTGNIFKTDSISNFLPQFNPHLIADTFRHRHGSHSARLGAPDHPVFRVAVFVKILKYDMSSHRVPGSSARTIPTRSDCLFMMLQNLLVSMFSSYSFPRSIPLNAIHHRQWSLCKTIPYEIPKYFFICGSYLIEMGFQ